MYMENFDHRYLLGGDELVNSLGALLSPSFLNFK